MRNPPEAVKPERKAAEELNRASRLPVCVAPAVTSMPEFVEAWVVSTVKIGLPEPSWMRSAVLDEIFIKSPPAPVKPERKPPEEFLSSKRLAVGEAVEALMMSELVLAEAWFRVRVLLTRRVESMVEDARTNIPAVVVVGVMALVKTCSQAWELAPPPPQAEPVPETRPLVSVCRQLLAVPVMVLTVRAPAIVTAPLRRVVPNTESVVEGEAVPMPTKLSLALTANVPPSILMPVLSVVVAVALSGIWKMAVPPSSWTLKMLPVKLEAFTTSLTKSPEVRDEDEAVSQLSEVTVEEAVMNAPPVRLSLVPTVRVSASVEVELNVAARKSGRTNKPVPVSPVLRINKSSISVALRQSVQVTSTTRRSPPLLSKVASSVRLSKV